MNLRAGFGAEVFIYGRDLMPTPAVEEIFLAAESASYGVDVGLYAEILGDQWAQLAAPVRQAHTYRDVLKSKGVFRVRHGNHPVARLLTRLLRMPSEADNVETHLTITRTDRGERWLRTFEGKSLLTTQWKNTSGCLTERIGLLDFTFDLSAGEGALVFRQMCAGFGMGRRSIVLPHILMPRIDAREGGIETNKTHVSVQVSHPLLGLLISYEGEVTLEEVSE